MKRAMKIVRTRKAVRKEEKVIMYFDKGRGLFVGYAECQIAGKCR
jgi:hypothetical protein